jgi:hypothetical protein
MQQIYTKKSTISGIGNGLFANRDFKRKEIIVEFTGKLIPQKNVKDSRSSIIFTDGMVLDCPRDDLASFSNDCIKFPTKQRKLVNSLFKNKPFYKKYPNAIHNAILKLDEENGQHKAYLKAICDIKKDEEIFQHYGFHQWFCKELTTIGFLPEKFIERCGFPIPHIVYYSPAFKEYVKEFYPKAIDSGITGFKDKNKPSQVFIDFPNKKVVYMPIIDLPSTMHKVFRDNEEDMKKVRKQIKDLKIKDDATHTDV